MAESPKYDIKYNGNHISEIARSPAVRRVISFPKIPFKPRS